MAKITKAEFDALPQALKESFEADGDGYTLKTEDVSGLKSALESERKLKEDAERKAKAAEKQAKQFEGVDFEAAKAALADVEAAKLEAAKKAGNFDDIIKAKDLEWSGKLTASDERAAKAEQRLLERDIESQMVSILAAQKVRTDRMEDAKQLMRPLIEVETREDKTVFKFKDDSGYASEMKPEDFGKKFAEKRDYLFQSEGNGGGGERNGGVAPTFQDHSKLPATERLKLGYKTAS